MLGANYAPFEATLRLSILLIPAHRPGREVPSRGGGGHRAPGCVSPTVSIVGCRSTRTSAARARIGRQFPQIRLIPLLPVAVDLPGIEGQAGCHPPAGRHLLQTFRNSIKPCVPVKLGALELEGRKARGPEDHVMRIVKVPVPGGKPRFAG